MMLSGRSIPPVALQIGTRPESNHHIRVAAGLLNEARQLASRYRAPTLPAAAKEVVTRERRLCWGITQTAD